MVTLAKQWEAEGFAKGFAKGFAESYAEGYAFSILRVLEVRQKGLTLEQRASIEQCRDIACFEAWLDKAVTLDDPRELFEPSA
jgi:hypothetical protein